MGQLNISTSLTLSNEPKVCILIHGLLSTYPFPCPLCFSKLYFSYNTWSMYEYQGNIVLIKCTCLAAICLLLCAAVSYAAKRGSFKGVKVEERIACECSYRVICSQLMISLNPTTRCIFVSMGSFQFLICLTFIGCKHTTNKEVTIYWTIPFSLLIDH